LKEFPDILGLKLVEAEKILNAMACDFIVSETVSQRKQPVEGDYRVIRQRIEGDVLAVTICRIPD
jgi:hypothetical protein